MPACEAQDQQDPREGDHHVRHGEPLDAERHLRAEVDERRRSHVAGAHHEGVDRRFSLALGVARGRQEQGLLQRFCSEYSVPFSTTFTTASSPGSGQSATVPSPLARHARAPDDVQIMQPTTSSAATSISPNGPTEPMPRAATNTANNTKITTVTVNRRHLVAGRRSL